MSALAEIDSLIREAEHRHACNLRRLLDVRGAIVKSLPAGNDPEWLSLAEIAALPPRRTPEAVRKVIARTKPVPSEVRRCGRAAVYPRSWLISVGILKAE